MIAFNFAQTRADFPILSRQVNGHSLAYLDNAASAQKPRTVIEGMAHMMAHSYANVHRGLHTLANEATEAFEGARASVAHYLKAPSSQQIIFTRSATAALNTVAAGLARVHLSAGDEILLSLMEHHSNIVPWQMAAERTGAVIRWMDVDEAGDLDLEAALKQITLRTKVVAITQMSNVLGTITPLPALIEAAHAVGAVVVVDGSQGAVHLDVDLGTLNPDFYVCTGHKLYGPTGIGVLYGRMDWLERLPPFEGGGEMIETVTLEGYSTAPVPAKFEAGTPPIVEAYGLGLAVDYLMAQDRMALHAHEQALLAFANEQMRGFKGLRILGTSENKGAILSFTTVFAHAHDVAMVLDRYGLAVRAGTHCAQPLLKRFGVTSSCRASFAFYNTFEEVERLVMALGKAKALFE